MAWLYDPRLGPKQSSTYKWKEDDLQGSATDALVAKSTTLYVGNLSFYTTEEQIWELFTKCGDIKRIIMGLNRDTKTPCGFCFVEYWARDSAADCVRWINGTRLDDRVIRVDWDIGFTEERQYGRGKSGGQVRDEFRRDYDPGRGGYGEFMKEEQEEKQGQGTKRPLGPSEETDQRDAKRPKVENPQ